MMKELHFEKLPSTHLYAKENINSLRTHNMVLISTDYQTNGIGRRKGTSWLSTKGENLLWTIFLKGPLKAPMHNAAQILALSLLKTLPKKLSPKFKWPNDLLLSGKKFAGVMGDVIDNDLILSVGVNVNISVENLKSIDIPVTSLSVELEEKVDLDSFKKEYLKTIEKDLAQFKQDGFTPFVKLARDFLALVGEKVQIDTIKGILKDIDDQGRLLVETEKGIETISSGHLVRL